MPVKVVWRVIFVFMLCVAALVFYAFGGWAYVGVHNYQGYCVSAGKVHDVKLATDERLNIAVDEYLENQDSTDFHEMACIEKNSNGSMVGHEFLRGNFKLLIYPSESEFFKANPACCSRTWVCSKVIGLASGSVSEAPVTVFLSFLTRYNIQQKTESQKNLMRPALS